MAFLAFTAALASGGAMVYGVTLGLLLALAEPLPPASALTTLIRGVNWHEVTLADLQTATAIVLIVWMALVASACAAASLSWRSIPLRTTAVNATILVAILVVSPWSTVAWICGLLVLWRAACAVRSRLNPPGSHPGDVAPHARVAPLPSGGVMEWARATAPAGGEHAAVDWARAHTEQWTAQVCVPLARQCRHEAAHAVTAHVVGLVVVGVHVRPNGDIGGETWNHTPVLEPMPPVDVNWARLVTAVAGGVLDRADGHHGVGSRNDTRTAIEFVCSIRSCRQTPAALRVADTSGWDLLTWLNAAEEAAASVLTAHGAAVDALAECLEQARGLSGREARAFLSQHTGVEGAR